MPSIDHFVRFLFSTLTGPKSARSLSVFIFHRVLNSPDPLFPGEVDIAAFDEMLDWIGGAFNVMPLSTGLDALKAGTLPTRAAAITFDDGYADNLTNAAPLLKAHGMSATFFIATGFLDGGIMFNDMIIESVRRTPHEALSLEALGLAHLPVNTTEDKRRAIDAILDKVKFLPQAQRAEAAALVRDRASVELPTDLMLTSNELIRLRDCGMEIGAHTMTHPILTRVSAEVAKAEIENGRDRLEELLGQRIRVFAYPNGKRGRDYSDEHVTMVRDAGFDYAMSTDWGVARQGTDLFQLPRFTPWDRSRLRFNARLAKNMFQANKM